MAKSKEYLRSEYYAKLVQYVNPGNPFQNNVYVTGFELYSKLNPNIGKSLFKNGYKMIILKNGNFTFKQKDSFSDPNLILSDNSYSHNSKTYIENLNMDTNHKYPIFNIVNQRYSHIYPLPSVLIGIRKVNNKAPFANIEGKNFKISISIKTNIFGKRFRYMKYPKNGKNKFYDCANIKPIYQPDEIKSLSIFINNSIHDRIDYYIKSKNHLHFNYKIFLNEDLFCKLYNASYYSPLADLISFKNPDRYRITVKFMSIIIYLSILYDKYGPEIFVTDSNINSLYRCIRYEIFSNFDLFKNK